MEGEADGVSGVRVQSQVCAASPNQPPSYFGSWEVRAQGSNLHLLGQQMTLFPLHSVQAQHRAAEDFLDSSVNQRRAGPRPDDSGSDY